MVARALTPTPSRDHYGQAADSPLGVGLPAPADARFGVPRGKGVGPATPGGAVRDASHAAERGLRPRDDG